MCCQISKCTWSSIRVGLLFTDKDEERDSTQLVTWRFDCALCFPLLYLWLLSLCRGLRLAASLSEPQLRWDMAKGYSEVKLISMPHCFSFQLGTVKECNSANPLVLNFIELLLHCCTVLLNFAAQHRENVAKKGSQNPHGSCIRLAARNGFISRSIPNRTIKEILHPAWPT